MAKIWINYPLPAGGRSQEFSMAKGDELTGRFYFEVGSESGTKAVEVWDKSVLILQSKAIPVGEGFNETALISKFTTDGFAVGNLVEVFSRDQVSGSRILSFVTAATAVATSVWLEVSQA